MAQRVTLIRGEGIGPELAEATRRVLDASGVAFEWEIVDAGEAVMAEFGTPLPDRVLESIRHGPERRGRGKPIGGATEGRWRLRSHRSNHSCLMRQCQPKLPISFLRR